LRLQGTPGPKWPRGDLDGDGTGEMERETDGQGNTGTDGVAVGRTGVTVTVGPTVAVTLGVTVGVTVAVTGSGGGSGVRSTGSRKPLSGGWMTGGVNGEGGTPARTAVM
jgi:hypothetical protein